MIPESNALPFCVTLAATDPSASGGPDDHRQPPVSECTVAGCSYNDHGCHAFAITVSGTDGHAGCGTFVPLTIKGGLPRAEAQVGACQRTDCRHNDALECRASDIRVGFDHDTASCLTYTTA